MFTQPQPAASTPAHDRLSYLWLALALVLLPFGTARWTIPLAAWLYPVFLLRFIRTQPLRRGIPLAWVATGLVIGVAWIGFLPHWPAVLYIGAAIGIGLFFTLPYLFDRAVAPRLGGLLGTLVFPLALTTVRYLWAWVSPFGTQYNQADTQYGNLPLLQWLSVTGLWGITLLMGWFAAMVNWAWERDFAWPRVRGGAALCGGVLAIVLLFGGARLALFPAQGSTVRVAGISPSPAVIDAYGKQYTQLSPGDMQALVAGHPTAATRESIRQTSTPYFDGLFARSEQEAKAGAKIIVWPEQSSGVIILEEDKAPLLARAGEFARATGTYLDLGVTVILQQPVKSSYFTDESILFDPNGHVAWDYEKVHPVAGVELAYPGEAKVPTVETPYGRLAGVICYDADFPGLLRQAGQAGADILLVPSNDWQEIDPYHTQVTALRAIENGASLVRQTSNGLAMAVDYQGNVLATADYFTNDPQVMVAYVPIRGVRTIYAAIGDLFAWLSLAGLVALIGLALVRRTKVGEARVAEPDGAPLPVP